MIYFRLGLKNAWKQRRRNVFTLLSVTVGIAGLINLCGYINRWRMTLSYSSVYLQGRGTYAIYPEDGQEMGKYYPKNYSFTAAEKEAISAFVRKEAADVEYIGSYLHSSGLVSNGCQATPYEVLGYEVGLDKTIRSRPDVIQWCMNLVKFNAGEAFHVHPQTNIVGVSRGLAKILGKELTLSETKSSEAVDDIHAYCEPEGLHQRTSIDPNLQMISKNRDGQIALEDVDIAHIFSTGVAATDDFKLTAPLELVQKLYESDDISYLAVYLKDFSGAQKKAAALQKKLRDAGFKVEVFAWDNPDANPYYVSTMNFLYTVGLFFLVIVLVVVGLSVNNLTTMNVLDRSREIGTLKALGYRQSSISQIFLIESCILAGIGCILGLALAYVGVAAINAADIRFIPPGGAFPALLFIAPNFVLTFGILLSMFLVVTLSAFVTSYKNTKRSCLELLTHN